jgi:hypothetical protein
MPESTASQRLFRLSAERRVAPRVRISIGGRFMLENRTEYGGTASEASLQALVVEADCTPRIGERVVGYFYSIGRVEGQVVRLMPGGFVIEMVTTLVKRDKLANQLTWLANREILNLPEDRRHDRVVPRDPRIAVTNLASPAAPMQAHLIDVSRSGAAVAVRGDFTRGDEIMLGTTPARVVRAFEGGIAVEFHGSVPDAMFDVDIRL